MTQKSDSPGRGEPPDGGWGWVVVASCNIMLQLSLFVRFTGIFFNEWKDYFGATAMAVGAVSSAHSAAFLFMGPLGGILCKKLGPRKLGMGSGFITFISLIIASQAKGLMTLILTYGVLAGLSSGFCYICITDIISKYFKKRYAIANSISNSGGGLCIITFPVVASFLINLYNWNGALFVWAAITANVCVCALLFRPLRRAPWKSLSKESVELGGEKQGPAPEERTQLTTETEQESLLMQKVDSADRRSVHSNGNLYARMPSTSDADRPEGSRCLNSIPTEPPLSVSASSICDLDIDEHDQNPVADSTRELPFTSEGPTPERRLSETTQTPVEEGKDSRLKERRPTRGSIYLGHFVKGTGLYLFKTKRRFTLLCLIQTILGLSYTAVSIHFIPCAIDSGVSKLDAALLLSISGVGSLLGRLASGPLVGYKILGPVLMYFLLLLTCGVSIMVIPVIGTYAGYVIFSLVFGFSSGMYKALQFVLIRKFVGPDRVATGTGIMMPFIGVGNIVGPLLAGHLFDIRGQYDLAFYICGSISVATAFLLALMPYLGRCEEQQEDSCSKDSEIEAGEVNLQQTLGSINSLAAV